MAELKTIKIVSTPDILGGKPRLEGRRISVQHVVEHHLRSGMSLDEMEEAFGLSAAEVYAALSFYYQHQVDIDEAIQADDSRSDEAPQIESLIQLLDKTIGTAEAAERLGITERAVRSLISSGTLPATKVGDYWVIHPTDLDRDEVRNRRPGRPSRS